MSSKRDPKVWIGDILDSIQEIEDTLQNVEADTFVTNRIFINAVPYALIKFSEATKHLLQSGLDLPSNEPWSDIYSLGNQLRHAYFGINQERIWQITTHDLHSLKTTCADLFVKLQTQESDTPPSMDKPKD